MTPDERGKLVLSLCEYELRSCSVGSLMTLQCAITAQIKDAIYEALKSIQKNGAPLDPLKQLNLFKIGKRPKRDDS